MHNQLLIYNVIKKMYLGHLQITPMLHVSSEKQTPYTITKIIVNHKFYSYIFSTLPPAILWKFSQILTLKYRI